MPHIQPLKPRTGRGPRSGCESRAIIKSVLADPLDMHLDLFQRIYRGPRPGIDPSYGGSRSSVYAANTETGRLSWLRTASTLAVHP